MQDESKIGRRAWGRMLAATAVGAGVSTVSAQAPAAAPAPPAPQDDPLLRQAHAAQREDAREIASIPLARTIEPAFRFKA